MFPRMRHLWLDAGYNAQEKEKGAHWVRKVLGWRARIVKRPRRWVRVPETGEAFMYVAMTRLMVRRLARS